jgi:hypothetical protein
MDVVKCLGVFIDYLIHLMIQISFVDHPSRALSTAIAQSMIKSQGYYKSWKVTESIETNSRKLMLEEGKKE